MPTIELLGRIEILERERDSAVEEVQQLRAELHAREAVEKRPSVCSACGHVAWPLNNPYTFNQTASAEKRQIVLQWEDEEPEGPGYWFAYLPAFGSVACNAMGLTIPDALRNLEAVYTEVTEHYKETSRPLPKPIDQEDILSRIHIWANTTKHGEAAAEVLAIISHLLQR